MTGKRGDRAPDEPQLSRPAEVAIALLLTVADIAKGGWIICGVSAVALILYSDRIAHAPRPRSPGDFPAFVVGLVGAAVVFGVAALAIYFTARRLEDLAVRRYQRRKAERARQARAAARRERSAR